MNLFDELAKDSEEYLKNYDEGTEGANGDVMKQIADLEKKMTEKLEEATKNLTKTPDAEGVEGAKGENVGKTPDDTAGKTPDKHNESEDK